MAEFKAAYAKAIATKHFRPATERNRCFCHCLALSTTVSASAAGQDAPRSAAAAASRPLRLPPPRCRRPRLRVAAADGRRFHEQGPLGKQLVEAEMRLAEMSKSKKNTRRTRRSARPRTAQERERARAHDERRQRVPAVDRAKSAAACRPTMVKEWRSDLGAARTKIPSPRATCIQPQLDLLVQASNEAQQAKERADRARAPAHGRVRAPAFRPAGASQVNSMRQLSVRPLAPGLVRDSPRRHHRHRRRRLIVAFRSLRRRGAAARHRASCRPATSAQPPASSSR